MEMKQKWKERRRKHECNRSNQKQKKYPEVPGSAVIPQEDLDLILEAAMMAPSARNTRPWEFVVVENRKILEKFRDIQLYRDDEDGFSGHRSVWTSGTPGRRKRVLAPGLWSAIENILLQALELGYGTCWCGFYPVEDRVKGFQELLGVESIPVGAVAVGIAEEAPAARGYYDKSRVKYIK